jgi:hypothetical protein
MRRPIQTGDRVKLDAKFLRSIACYTGSPCFARGTVTAIRTYGGQSGVTVATVKWDDPPTDSESNGGVCVANLVRIDDMHLKCVE